MRRWFQAMRNPALLYGHVTAYFAGWRCFVAKSEAPFGWQSTDIDTEYQTRIDAERCTLEFSKGKGKRLDSGKEPITDSPLWGGSRQGMLIDWESTDV